VVAVAVKKDMTVLAARRLGPRLNEEVSSPIADGSVDP
jgi:hypothetical protein